MCESIMKNIFRIYANESVRRKIDAKGEGFFLFLNKRLESIFKETKFKYPLNEEFEIPYEI